MCRNSLCLFDLCLYATLLCTAHPTACQGLVFVHAAGCTGVICESAGASIIAMHMRLRMRICAA